MMGTTDWLGAGARIGDYVVERELAAKPGLVAWSATHTLLPRRARISTVHPAFVEVPAVAMQLTREACLLEALRHPGVPRVFECGHLPDRRPWVASELIEGVSLATILAEDGRLAMPMVLALLAEVAEILHHVHTRGLVHRNLRPDAITRRSEGPSIIDWGDARGRDEDPIAHVPQDRGAYQSPEVVAGEPGDSRADVFALGVIACEALAGVRTARATAHRFPSAPARLTALLDRMLARDPVARPTSAEVRAEALAIAEQVAAVVAPPADEDGADVQIEDVELGTGLAAEAEAAVEPPPPPLPPPADADWASDFSQRARTRTMPAMDMVEISAKKTKSMSAVELDALTKTRKMPAVDPSELDGPASRTRSMPALDPGELEGAAAKTTTMEAVEPEDLDGSRTKTDPMPPDEQSMSRTKTETMPPDAGLKLEPEPAAPPPAPPRTATRIGKVVPPARILDRSRTKTS
jgi:serine/threonine-protein kinase